MTDKLVLHDQGLIESFKEAGFAATATASVEAMFWHVTSGRVSPEDAMGDESVLVAIDEELRSPRFAYVHQVLTSFPDGLDDIRAELRQQGSGNRRISDIPGLIEGLGIKDEAGVQVNLSSTNVFSANVMVYYQETTPVQVERPGIRSISFWDEPVNAWDMGLDIANGKGDFGKVSLTVRSDGVHDPDLRMTAFETGFDISRGEYRYRVDEDTGLLVPTRWR